jgi:hypothetical protein
MVEYFESCEMKDYLDNYSFKQINSIKSEMVAMLKKQVYEYVKDMQV